MCKDVWQFACKIYMFMIFFAAMQGNVSKRLKCRLKCLCAGIEWFWREQCGSITNGQTNQSKCWSPNSISYPMDLPYSEWARGTSTLSNGSFSEAVCLDQFNLNRLFGEGRWLHLCGVSDETWMECYFGIALNPQWFPVGGYKHMGTDVTFVWSCCIKKSFDKKIVACWLSTPTEIAEWTLGGSIVPVIMVVLQHAALPHNLLWPHW